MEKKNCYANLYSCLFSSHYTPCSQNLKKFMLFLHVTGLLWGAITVKFSKTPTSTSFLSKMPQRWYLCENHSPHIWLYLHCVAVFCSIYREKQVRGGGLPSYIHSFSYWTKIDKLFLFLLEKSPICPVGPWGKRPTFSFAWETRVLLRSNIRSNKFMNVEEGNMLFNFSTKGGYREICWKALWYM